MVYQLVADQPDIVIWVDEHGSSGVLREGDPGWQDYLAWLSSGCAPSPQVTREDAERLVEQEFELACSMLKDGYPQAEVDSWPLQAAEAKSFMLDPSAKTPLIDGLLLPWEDKDAFCQEVQKRSETYLSGMGEILAWRRIANAAVEAMFANGPRHRFDIKYPHLPDVE